MEVNQVSLYLKELRKKLNGLALSVPQLHLLGDEEQKKYDDAIKQYSGKASETLRLGKKGSHLFKVILLNQIGIVTASAFQMYEGIENNPAFLSERYSDITKVVLRSAGDSYTPNDSLEKSLVEATKLKNFNHAIVLGGLEIKADSNSEYGLGLVPGEKFFHYEAPEFDYCYNGINFLQVDERDIPILLSDDQINQLSEEERNNLKTSYTRDNGLSRLYVNRSRDLGSRYGLLAGSVDDGRVVVVGSAKGT